MTYPHPNSNNPIILILINSTTTGICVITLDQIIHKMDNIYSGITTTTTLCCKRIQTTGYLANPAGMYMGHPPNNYMQMKKH